MTEEKTIADLIYEQWYISKGQHRGEMPTMIVVHETMFRKFCREDKMWGYVRPDIHPDETAYAKFCGADLVGSPHVKPNSIRICYE